MQPDDRWRKKRKALHEQLKFLKGAFANTLLSWEGEVSVEGERKKRNLWPIGRPRLARFARFEVIIIVDGRL